MAIVLAWGITALAFSAFRIAAARPRLRRGVMGAGAFVVTTAAVYRVTGKRDLFFLYGGQLDTQSGDVSHAEVAHTPTLSLGLVPVKLVQLFVDPCYLSLCRISDYRDGRRATARTSTSGACRSRYSSRSSCSSRSASSGSRTSSFGRSGIG